MSVTRTLLCIFLAALAIPRCTSAAVVDEFKVKREEIFEFTQQPILKRDGDKVIISFTSKAYCDATIAVEDSARLIVRHLARGVPWLHAPKPFQHNAHKQPIVCDSNDDPGDDVVHPPGSPRRAQR